MSPHEWYGKEWMLLAISLLAFLVAAKFQNTIAQAILTVLGLVLMIIRIVGGYIYWRCPSCGNFLPERAGKVAYCPRCGKRIGRKRKKGCKEGDRHESDPVE